MPGPEGQNQWLRKKKMKQPGGQPLAECSKMPFTQILSRITCKKLEFNHHKTVNIDKN